jgi:thiol-disulfide isomerase/thioredoxin
VSLSQYKGKVVLLNFWATWCHGCKQEIPWYMEFADKYKDRGFVVIGVSMDEDGWKSVKPFLQEKKMNYPVIIGNQELMNQYGGDSMPVSVLIDREGKIADLHSGVVNKGGWEREIQQLLGESSKPVSK